MHRHLAIGERHGLAGTSERVCPPATDLEGAVRRRALRDGAGQLGERRLDPRSIGRVAVGRRELTFEVVRRRGRPEADGGPVRLPITEVILDDACPVAEEDRQDTGRERVQGPAVPHPFRRGETSDQGDDVM